MIGLSGFGQRGQRLWDQFTASSQLGPAQVVLLEEACRLADRMDRLDAILSGDQEAWLRLSVGDESITVEVDSALGEARQHATAFKQILAELRQGVKSGRPGRPRQESSSGVRSGVADLSARIAQRRSQTAG